MKTKTAFAPAPLKERVNAVCEFPKEEAFIVTHCRRKESKFRTFYRRSELAVCVLLDPLEL